MSNSNSPKVKVGIVSAVHLKFKLHGRYRLLQDEASYEGEMEVSAKGLQICFNNKVFSRLNFMPLCEQCYFELYDVVIGKNFHWEKKETQSFEDNLNIINENGSLTAINEIDVEKYLKSVISSEMNATSSVELLKAHAVISRSWVISQLTKKKSFEKSYRSSSNNNHIRWYDHDDHHNFDVCADDHCQRYQGLGRESSPSVSCAIEDTRGEVLTYDGKICDARFSKSCGGVTELFSSCWDDVDYPYLQSVVDCDVSEDKESIGDLTNEECARNWILATPEAFCNTSDAEVLKQILNDYDLATKDFFRWNVVLSQKEIRNLVETKVGLTFGNILNLIPLERGKSARITKLKIEGEQRSLIVGKELEIRRILSPTHLLSSAFVVDVIFDGKDKEKVPSKFVLHGAGWGHGVGLCQIGAAVMAHKGYGYQKILSHYYQKSAITPNYGRTAD